jgi:hypothetical protein
MPNNSNRGNNMSSEERSKAQPKGEGSHDVSPQSRERMAEGGRKGGENSQGGNSGGSSRSTGGSQGRSGNQNATGKHEVSPQGRKKMSEGGRKGGEK